MAKARLPKFKPKKLSQDEALIEVDQAIRHWAAVGRLNAQLQADFRLTTDEIEDLRMTRRRLRQWFRAINRARALALLPARRSMGDSQFGPGSLERAGCVSISIEAAFDRDTETLRVIEEQLVIGIDAALGLHGFAMSVTDEERRLEDVFGALKEWRSPGKKGGTPPTKNYPKLYLLIAKLELLGLSGRQACRRAAAVIAEITHDDSDNLSDTLHSMYQKAGTKPTKKLG